MSRTWNISLFSFNDYSLYHSYRTPNRYRRRKAREEGTKGYMCKSDSKTFNSFVKDRKKDDMAPPDEPGYIAVECYGREAVRGGGWCTYAVCKDEVDNSWTPEKKMIHNKKEDEDEE